MSNTTEHIFGEYLTPGGGGFAKQSYDATLDQTTFPLSQSIDTFNTAVFRNGHVLDGTDYSFTDEFTLELVQGANAGDDITLLDFGASGVGAFIRFAFTAIAAQTDFLFDDPINELAAIVFVDGDIVDPADYTLNDVLLQFNTGLSVGQNVVVISWRFGQIGADGLPIQTGQGGRILSTNGTNTEWVDPSAAILPDQTGNTGKYLQTDGVDATWQDVIHPEELPDQTGNAGFVLVTNGATPLWVDPSVAIKNVKNDIVNGNFDVWQRGTSFVNPTPVNLAPTADKWSVLRTGSLATITREDFTLGQTDVPHFPKHYYRSNLSIGGTFSGHFAILGQRIGKVTKHAGKSYTLSFWAKADATKDIAIEFVQHFGTGGSPSPLVVGDNFNQSLRKVTLTTLWQKFVITMDWPSISGKTLGTINNNFSAVFLWQSGGAAYDARTDTLGLQNGIFDFAQVQFEEGSTAYGFVQEDFEDTLRKCQYFYRKSYNVDTAPGSITTQGTLTTHVGSPSGVAHSSGTQDSLIDLRDDFDNMLGVPTVTFYSPNTGASGNVHNVTGAADAAIASTVLTGQTSTGYPVLSSPANSGDIVRAHYTAEADY
jgi:hypothetical protein